MFLSAGASESASERSSVWRPMVARPCVFVHRVFIQMFFVLMWEVCSMLDMRCERSYGKGSFWILFKPEFLQLVWQFFSFAFLLLSFLPSLSFFLLFLFLSIFLSFLQKTSRCSTEHSLVKSDTKWGRSVWMCVRVCMYMYAYLYCSYSCMYAQQCTSAYVCKRMYACVYMYMCMHICICTYMCVHVCYANCVMEPETVIFLGWGCGFISLPWRNG